jgi:hypothetical protein
MAHFGRSSLRWAPAPPRPPKIQASTSLTRTDVEEASP